MRRMKPGTKRVLTTVLAGILILAMLASLIIPLASAVFAASPTEISMEGSVGLGESGLYKVNRPTPVTVRIANGSTEIEGEVQVKVNLSFDPFHPHYVLYAYPIQMPPNGAKEITFDVVLPSIISDMQIFLMDAKGNTLSSLQLGLTAVSEESVLAGVFSDAFDHLSYLRLIELHDAFSGTSEKLGGSLLPLHQSKMPNSLDTLNLYNLIFINDYDTTQLSAEQVSLLNAWVQAGGTLVLGTGQHFDKVMRGLDALGLEATSSGTRALSVLNLYGTKEWALDGETYTAATLTMNGTPQAYGDDGMPVILEQKSGKGAILICGFDLGLSPIPEYIAFSTALSSIISACITQNGQTAHLQENAYGLVDSLPNMSGNTISLVFVFIVIYLVFLGPVLYLLLKKKDRRDAGWFIIPIVAVTCTLVVYLLSLNTMYKKPFLNSFTIMQLNQNNNVADATQYLGMYSPRKGDVTVQFDALIPLRGIADNFSHLYGSPYSMANSNNYKLILGDKPGATFYGRAQWELNELRSQRTITLPGGLDAQITCLSNPDDQLRGQISALVLEGTVTNNTGMALEDVTVLYSGIGYYALGDLAPGESRALHEDMRFNDPNINLTDTYYVANTLFPYWTTDAGRSNEDMRIDELKRSLLNTIYGYGMRPAASGAYRSPAYQPPSVTGMTPASSQALPTAATPLQITILAFSRTPMQSSTTINRQTPQRFDLSLLCMDVASSLSQDAYIELPFGTIRAAEVSANVYADRYETEIYLGEQGDVIFGYIAPAQMRVERVQFMVEDFSFMASKILIYNVQTGVWETLNPNGYMDAAAYFDEQNRVQIQGIDVQPSWTMIPQISIAGVTE